jgi:acetyl esterase/lipase
MKPRLPALFATGLLLLGLSLPVRAAKITRDITFATVDASTLKLDLYLPDSGSPAGLIVWVHGGAWKGGSRSGVELKALTEKGWAIASVDYRLSPVARFPAQIHDLKAAVRFLRAHATEYGYPASPIIAAGSSAGAHLAALLGVTNDLPALEGTVGTHLEISSDIQAIVSLYGASNLTSILAQSTPHGVGMRVPALELLLGGQPDKVPKLARLASPVFQVDAQDPPLLLLHGDQDPQMPINQSHELQGAYEKLGLPVVFKVLHGSAHGGPAFSAPGTLDLIDAFLRQHLRPAGR